MENAKHDAASVFAGFWKPPCAGAGAALCIPSPTGAADAFIALALAGGGGGRVVLAVTPGLPEADRLADDLSRLVAMDKTSEGAAQTRIFEFPPAIRGDKTAMGLRFKTAAAMRSYAMRPYAAVVVAPAAALSGYVGGAEGEGPGAQKPLELRCYDDEDAPRAIGDGGTTFSAFCASLASMGYSRCPMVEREGDWAVRGGIVDVWSPGEESPLRAEFFGEDLESLRIFDPGTQVSLMRVQTASIVPCADDSQEAEAPAGGAGSFFSLLPAGSAVLALEHNEYSLAIADARRFEIVWAGDPAPPGVPSYNFQTASLPGFAELGANAARHPELFDAARQRLENHVAAAAARGAVVIRADDLSGGFEIPGFVVVTKADRVFARRRSLRRAGARGAARAAGARIGDFEELEPGEYVVHSAHGVGRFIGSSEIVVDGNRSEVFTIEYEGGALLHVPAEHAHLVTRYVGVKGEHVKMHRLDGKGWKNDCEKAKRAVADLAAALLETQARRQMLPGFACEIPCDGLEAFEAAFPYEETPDQAAAIAAVKADLASPRPMDRLVCGDAGYGKTEVAMRAAYIAAMNGRQVALLAPTTVLAEQHFETFTSRFDGTPLRIEVMSRIQSKSVREGTVQRLAAGVCDIVIGTHAILSPSVVFRNLGLVIIDEEQRFGVRHKEHLKRLRAATDVLTLSATPIPRTLYLSMTGARDLSLLRTPPRERVAVETKIVRDDDAVVRSAIRAELARGGQVYFLHNRVDTIARVEKRLKTLCPEARIVVAHGRMDAETLAERVRDFSLGKMDVLLSTTIVESGVDIPRANTILIDRADTFGLADLYQLRGRVGRSSRQGYAYLLLPSSGAIDSEARERLSALQRHGALGAGFNLAVRDLELRGAGNLLGSQQSGHIAAVGFTLYCQLLQRTIAAMKGEKVMDVVDVRMSLDFIELSPADSSAARCAALPYSYIEEDTQRLAFLRRFAEAMDEKAVKALERELVDRFGRMPDAARRFVRLAKIRVLCAKAKCAEIDVKDRRAVFRAPGGAIARVEMLDGETPDALLASLERILRRYA